MPDSDTPIPDAESVEARPRGPVASFFRSRRGIVLTVIVGVIAVVAVVLGVPVSRYAVLGLIVTRDARVVIVDSSTHKPVQGVRVAAGDVTATTNAKGVATLRALPVGPHGVRLTKQYYRSATTEVMVPILSAAAPARPRLVATGFPLEVVAQDRISGAAISGAEVAIGSAKATTDSAGVASIVVAVAPSAQAGTVTKNGYNQAAISVDVAQRQSHLDASLTATGTLRYLSKATGVINVMEANLDGTDAKVVLAGTGSESDDSTTLLTTTD